MSGKPIKDFKMAKRDLLWVLAYDSYFRADFKRAQAVEAERKDDDVLAGSLRAKAADDHLAGDRLMEMVEGEAVR